MRAHFAYGRAGPRPMSDMPYSVRRWTGFSPSRTSGSARPTMTDMAYSRYALRISSSSARGSMLPPPMTSVPAMLRHPLLDIQVGDEAGVLLDELASRLDLVAHQHREQLGRRQRVLDVDLLQ